MKNTNLIKRIDMERVFCYNEDFYKDKDDRKELEKVLQSVENSSEFKSFFFFSDLGYSTYYYESSKEEELKQYLSKALAPYKLEERFFEDFRQSLIDNCDEYNHIELHSRLGEIYIKEQHLCELLHDEFLNEEEYINRLVEAEDFYAELNNIKKECLEYLFDMAVTEAKQELENIKF